jgi:hypothetical protein
MAWRHPAEQALTDVADEEGDDSLRVMASMEGDVDVTMAGTARIEVREQWINIVALGLPLLGTHAPGTIQLSYDGLARLLRLLGAIQASVVGEEALLPAA